MTRRSFSHFLYGLPVLFVAALPHADLQAQDTTNFPSIGIVERYDPALDELIAKDTPIQVLAGGFTWSEGPVWIADQEHPFGGYLLFSEIPSNTVLRWDEGKGISTFLHPSGYTGASDYGKEPGSNGLRLDHEGRLLSCEHGDRRVSVLTKEGGKMTLADRWDGKRLNSPNDLTIAKDGTIYFTDPPYGLPNRYDDPRREQDFCGVYRITTDGKVELLTKEMTRPNGISLSPDEKTLYVANSDGKLPIWKSFPVKSDGTLGKGQLFFDASDAVAAGDIGGCDGLKCDEKGNVWATGPGGCWIFSPEGKPLGRINTGERIANCAWGNGGTVLYLTSDTYLVRIQTLVKGSRIGK